MFDYESFIDGAGDDGKGALLLNEDGEVVFACQPVSILGGKDSVTATDWDAMDLADRERFTVLRWKLDVVRAQVKAGRKQLADDDTPLLGRLAEMLDRRGKPADDDVAERVIKLQDSEKALLAQLATLRTGAKAQSGQHSRDVRKETKSAWLDDVDALIDSLEDED